MYKSMSILICAVDGKNITYLFLFIISMKLTWRVTKKLFSLHNNRIASYKTTQPIAIVVNLMIEEKFDISYYMIRVDIVGTYLKLTHPALPAWGAVHNTVTSAFAN